jgi:hypothetical protein
MLTSFLPVSVTNQIQSQSFFLKLDAETWEKEDRTLSSVAFYDVLYFDIW